MLWCSIILFWHFPVMLCKTSLDFRHANVLIIPAPPAHSCLLCPGVLHIDFNPASEVQSLSSLLGFLHVSLPNCSLSADLMVVYLPYNCLYNFCLLGLNCLFWPFTLSYFALLLGTIVSSFYIYCLYLICYMYLAYLPVLAIGFLIILACWSGLAVFTSKHYGLLIWFSRFYCLLLHSLPVS